MNPLRLFAIILFWSATGAAWAGIELDISREPVIMDESFHLTFHVTDASGGKPDFSPLEESFGIIGRKRQSSLKWINGRRKQATSWIITAMPLYTGQVEIPSLAFGSERSPSRMIEVVPATHTTPASDARIVIQVDAAPRSAYVQQQVIYTVQLLHRVELDTPRFSSLTTSSDAIIKQLGRGRNYVHTMAGRSYDALELRYAIYPQKSGSLTIHPIVLTAQMTIGKRTFFDPFSRNVTTKRVESESIALAIKPIPSEFPSGATWLPAQRVRLYDDWEPDIEQADVGQPLHRTIFLWADGLMSGQLPQLRFDPPSGIKLYPDQPQANEQDTPTGFTAVVEERFAFIASRAGTSRFAAIEVPWWNTETDRLERARLPARRLRIADAAVSGREAATRDAAGSEAHVPEPARRTSPFVAAATRFWAALTLTLLCMAMIALWWRRARGHGDLDKTSRKRFGVARATRELKHACQVNAAARARHALMDWSSAMAAAKRSTEVRSLRALADQTGGELAREIKVLERYLYGKSVDPWQGQTLWEAFRRQRPARTVARTPSDDPLPLIFKLSVK